MGFKVQEYLTIIDKQVRGKSRFRGWREKYCLCGPSKVTEDAFHVGGRERIDWIFEFNQGRLCVTFLDRFNNNFHEKYITRHPSLPRDQFCLYWQRVHDRIPITGEGWLHVRDNRRWPPE